MFFKIDGEFVCQTARSFVIEERWEDAIHLLNDCINGSNFEIALSILKGEKKFVGIDDLKLVDEDPNDAELQKYISIANYQFCGILKDGSNYWRPYAYVDAWCELDLNSRFMDANKYNSSILSSIPSYSTSNHPEWGAARCNYYMVDPKNDRAKIVKINEQDTYVLWRQIRVPPLWVNTYYQWQEAIDNYLLFELLEHRGAHAHREAFNQIRKNKEKKVKVLSEEEKTKIKKEIKRQEKIDKANDRKAVLEVLEKLQENDLNTSAGWLSPQGKLFPCKYGDHSYWSKFIFKATQGEKARSFDCEEALYRLGWQKLQSYQWVSLYKNDWRVSQKQYDLIEEYCQLHDKKMPSLIEVA